MERNMATFINKYFHFISVLSLLILIEQIESEDVKRNVALQGKAKQSSTEGDHAAELAIDNDQQTCSHTNGDTGGNWTIDLGAVHTIAHFLIDTGNTFFGSTFEVHTAERPYGSPVLCNYGDQAGEILDEYTVKCVDGVRVGRFITVTNVRSGGVRLCEFRAIECADGHFGDDCIKSCHCEGGKICDKKTGACPDNVKCAAGFSGTNCQTACKEGTFGASCLSTCHCVGSVACDPVTGVCPGGLCASPWLDPTCQTDIPRIMSAPNLFSSRFSDITLTWQSWSGYVHPNISLMYRIEYRFNEHHIIDDEWKEGPLVKDSIEFNEKAQVSGLIPNNFYDFRVIPILQLSNGTQVRGTQSPEGLSFRTRCTAPEATNVTSVTAWIDTSRSNPAPVIFVEWEPLKREQSNCENLKYYEIIYQKSTSESANWMSTGAKSTESAKNISKDVEFGLEYWVIVVAHNNEDLDSSSVRYTITTPAKPEVLIEKNKDKEGMNIAIIAGVIVCVALIVASTVAILLYRNKMKSYSSIPTKDVAINGVLKTELTVSKTDGSQAAMETSLMNPLEVTVVPMYPENGRINRDRKKPPPPKRYPIKVENLEEYIGSRRSNEHEELRKEYREIPDGNPEATMECGKKQPNQLKNRFVNIVPYDHSRVILDIVDGDEDSDYINANYLDGYKKPKAYIASQGCNKWTIQDLWRMLWQVNCHRIVMVTNLVEKGRTKCELYWPEKENEEKTYQDLHVTLTDMEKTADFVIRTFEVRRRKGATEGGDAVLLREGEEWEVRNVKQFHYTTWPDHGVPSRASPIIAFRRKLRSYDDTHPGPLITHCSAGVGRTGAFIAIDYLLEQAVAEGEVDVYNLTCRMRRDRVNMIQTVEQYIFVYDAVLEALRAGNTVIACAGFRASYDQLCRVDPEKHKSKIQEQFEMLQDILAKTKKEICSLGDQEENKEKNRFPHILPADKHRPYLMTRVQGTNDYINAVFIDGYRSKNAYIITQMPLPHTVIDLWRLVYEHECGTVVMLNPWDSCDESYGQYWPEENEECECGPFVIEAVSSSRQQEHIIARELKLTYNPDTSSSGTRKEVPPRVVNHFQLTCWGRDASMPDSNLSLLSLIEMVERSQKTSGNSTIVIHCHDGVRQSGLYAAVTSIWERVKDDQEVDIFQTVKHLQYHRPEAMQDIEQYKYCHEMVLTYLAEFETYSNYR